MSFLRFISIVSFFNSISEESRYFPFSKDEIIRSSLRVEAKEWELLYPLLLVRENHCFIPKEVEITRTQFEAKEECMLKIKELTNLERGILCILKEEYEINETSEAVTVKAKTYAEKDIAETVEFLAY